jgi:hypothetical protein
MLQTIDRGRNTTFKARYSRRKPQIVVSQMLDSVARDFLPPIQFGRRYSWFDRRMPALAVH